MTRNPRILATTQESKSMLGVRDFTAAPLLIDKTDPERESMIGEEVRV
jgi:hypothetical protein